ncbi:MAG: ABC transporter ATP-binding protein [Roseiflexaceae bacterium]
MSPIIQFEQVSKCFTLHTERRDTIQQQAIGLFQPRARGEEFWALRDISFQVNRGESLALVGHNGAGKSTILKLMTRILEPTSGHVQLHGRVAALLELGSGFHPDLSGRENVFLYGSLMGFGRREMEGRLAEIADFAEIGRFIDTEVKHYSSGMYTRLAFAVATAVDPDILITDEVLAVGDEAFQRKCMERIFEFRQRGKTIVFVSHALETVRTLCDRAVWLEGGQALMVGTAGEVVDAYLESVNRREQERLAAERGHADAGDATRRGTREIEIVAVELLGPQGTPQSVFRTHEAVTIRMHYQVHTPVERPVFGVALHHEGGLWLSGPNSRFDGVAIETLHGRGYIDYRIESLPLLTGRYLVSAAVYDDAMLHPYDHHDKRYRMVVQGSGVREHYGIVAVDGGWHIYEGE